MGAERVSEQILLRGCKKGLDRVGRDGTAVRYSVWMCVLDSRVVGRRMENIYNVKNIRSRSQVIICSITTGMCLLCYIESTCQRHILDGTALHPRMSLPSRVRRMDEKTWCKSKPMLMSKHSAIYPSFVLVACSHAIPNISDSIRILANKERSTPS